MASSKRERELARMRAERQAARRAAAEARRKQRRRILLVAGSGIAVLALVGGILLATSGDDDTDTLAAEPIASATATASGAATGTSCTYKDGAASVKKLSGKPPAQASSTVQTATVKTNRGTLTLELDGKNAPCTVNSFTYLTKQKYFDDTKCHRLVTSGIFVLQCGDPTATSKGGPGYTYDDEALEGATYPAGTLAMANSGPGTNGSQFFMVYKDTQLPPSYTPFGTIKGGLDIITKVAAAGDDGSNPAGGGVPKLPVDILSVTLAS